MYAILKNDILVEQKLKLGMFTHHLISACQIFSNSSHANHFAITDSWYMYFDILLKVFNPCTFSLQL